MDAKKARTHESDLFFSTSPDLLCVVDFDGRFVQVNPAWEKVFGFSSDQLCSRPYIEFVHPDDREHTTAAAERLIRDSATQVFESRYRLKDGSYKWFQWKCASLPERRRIFGNARDITELRQLREDLRASNETLEQLEQQLLRSQRLESLGTLASGIAHDLNNVLAPIGMALQLFRMRFLDAGTQNTLNVLDGCVDRGAGLIRQILTFARGVHSEHLPVQTRPLLLDAEKVLIETFPKLIAIRSDFPQDLWMVSADSTQLHQVLMNLCINARDAMQEGGTLTITAQNAVLDETNVRMNPGCSLGPYVVIEVQDTGHGMPAEIQEKIFEPFFTTKELGHGTGIGLSTVAAIVKNHGGFINLSSTVGKGTSFKIYFPALPGQEKQAGPAAIATVPVGVGELILMVEDESAVRDIGKMVLEAHGYRVIQAQDGAEGIAMFAQHVNEIRLVISDMDMPVMNGASMIGSLESIDPNVRVISASGLASNGGMSRNSSGASRYRAVLQKPYTAGELLRTVADVIKAE